VKKWFVLGNQNLPFSIEYGKNLKKYILIEKDKEIKP